MTSVSYSYFLDPSLPKFSKSLPSQNTAFASSSLASCSGSGLVVANDDALYAVRRLNGGNGNANNLNIISDDKSTLGIQHVLQTQGLLFRKPLASTPTVPNVNSLDRSSLLR
jgi:hypothetical protein